MEKHKARRNTGKLKSTARGVTSDAESTVSTRSSTSSSSNRSWKQKQRQLKASTAQQIEKDEHVAQFKSLGEVLETTEVQVAMIVLIALDVGCTAVSIHLNDQQQLNSKCTATKDVETSLLLRILTGLVDSFTGFTLFLFLIELAVLLAAFQRRFFSHTGYVLDLVVVSLSIAVELYAQTTGEQEDCSSSSRDISLTFILDSAARLLGVLRVWRVLRVVRRLVDLERAAHDTTRELLEQEELKLLHIQMQKDAAHESLKLEYESRAGLERLLRGYKDEIATLKEALQIAAEAVAEAEMINNPSVELELHEDAEDVVPESFVGSYPAVEEYVQEEAVVHPADLVGEQYWEGQVNEYLPLGVEDREEKMDPYQDVAVGHSQSENEFEDAVDE